MWGLQFFWSWYCFNLCWESDYEIGLYSSQFWGLPKLACFHKILKSISVCKLWNYCIVHIGRAHLAQVTRACCLQSLVFVKVELFLHFCEEDHKFTRALGPGHNKLKAIWCIVGQQTFCHKVVSIFFLFFFFACFFVEEERWPMRVEILLDPYL